MRFLVELLIPLGQAAGQWRLCFAAAVGIDRFKHPGQPADLIGCTITPTILAAACVIVGVPFAWRRTKRVRGA